jgi:hypothetical protein
LAAGAILLMTAAVHADSSPNVKSHPESYINADGSINKDRMARLLKKKSDIVQNSMSNLK